MRILLVITLYLLTACSQFGPRPLFIETDPPGSPEYKMGWKEGCESGYASMGTLFYKLTYSFRQNYTLMSNRDYVAGWHEGLYYCAHYALTWSLDDS